MLVLPLFFSEEQRYVIATIRFVLLLSCLSLIAACQPPATPEQQLRDRLTSEFVVASIGDLTLTSSPTPEGLKIACKIVLLMNPAEGMLIPPPLAEQLAASTLDAVKELFPEAIYLNLWVSTRPDTEKYQSPDSIDLDGMTLSLGMSRTDVSTALEDSDWSISHRGVDQWGLMARWPRSSKVYFENSSDVAKVVFLIPVSEKASGGGLSVLVADYNFPQSKE